MINKHRGEIEARFDGVAHRLVLTLGALAELESAFGDADMLQLAARFESGRLSSRDCVKIIGAGLRGAGYKIGDDEVANMQTDGGVAGFVDIVARLLMATFGVVVTDAGGVNLATADAGKNATGGSAEARGPFLGTT